MATPPWAGHFLEQQREVMEVCFIDVMNGLEPAEGWMTDLLSYINTYLGWTYDIDAELFMASGQWMIPTCWLCTLRQDIYWVWLPSKILNQALRIAQESQGT